MATNPSQTRICNKAAILLGTISRITAINDGTPLAQTFLGLWDETRDEVLADHPWNFALARAAPPAAAGADVPETGDYAFAYELPGDCLRWLPWRADDPDWFEGEQEGRFILSNADAPVTVRYIKRVEDVARWSPGFIDAMCAKLALYAAIPITGQSSMQDRMSQFYDDALRKAKRQDGLATGNRARGTVRQSDWLDARERPYGAG